MLISELQTPALVLDRSRLLHNIGRMRDRLSELSVPLRPHMKTAKSIDVARLALSGQPGGITVSTMREAEYFTDCGIDDILLSVGTSPDKLKRAAALQARGTRLTLIVDSPLMADLVAARAKELGAVFPILIEVDTDGHRAGVTPTDDALLEIGRIIQASSSLELAGVMAHAGSSYNCNTHTEIEALAEQERQGVVAASDRLRSVGLPCQTVSVGSTPTALFARDLTGVTEVRAGVYMFNDLTMVGLGVASRDDIALGVVATVVSHRPDLNRAIIDAGGMALSKDRGPGLRPGLANFGCVVRLGGGDALDLPVIGANQEHGLIEAAAQDFEAIPLGSKVLVQPYHACMTAAAYDRYHVTDDGLRVSEVWERCNGW